MSNQGSILFFQTRRELIHYLVHKGLAGIVDHKGLRCFTARDIIDVYRANRNTLFCYEVACDHWHERTWRKGYAEGVKATYDKIGHPVPADIIIYLKDGKIPRVSVPITSNALSRMCGELFVMAKEGVLHKVYSKVYTFINFSSETILDSDSPRLALRYTDSEVNAKSNTQKGESNDEVQSHKN